MMPYGSGGGVATISTSDRDEIIAALEAALSTSFENSLIAAFAQSGMFDLDMKIDFSRKNKSFNVVVT